MTAGGDQIDPSKISIIQNDPYTILIVKSPPGMGKTYTLIKRLEYLLENQFFDDPEIIVLTFTRAAVSTIRNRISPKLKYRTNVHTIDSFVGKKLYEHSVPFSGDYNASLTQFIDLIVHNETFLESVSGSAQYLIVDEAQDLTGYRLKIVELIIKYAKGATLFFDPNQYIYGFTLKEDDPKEEINDYCFNNWVKEKDILELKNSEDLNYRFSDRMASFETELRSKIENDNAYNEVSQFLDQSFSPLKIAQLEKKLINFDSTANIALLCRNNFQVWYLYCRLIYKGIFAEIVPRNNERIFPKWIAQTFYDYEASNIEKHNFNKIAEKRLVNISGKFDLLNSLISALSPDKIGVAIKLTDLAKVLENPSSQEFLMEKDYFDQNKIFLSTIHRAKGREFDNVYLYYSDINQGKSDIELNEEARVLYVGATRQKSEINRIDYAIYYGYYLNNGERWISIQKTNKGFPKTNILIGDIGDLDPDYIIERLSKDNFIKIQKRILNLELGKELTIHFLENEEKYVVCANEVIPKTISDDNIIGVMSSSFNRDLYYVSVHLQSKYKWVSMFKKRINTIKRVYYLGYYTHLCDKKNFSKPAYISGFSIAVRIGGATCSLWFGN